MKNIEEMREEEILDTIELVARLLVLKDAAIRLTDRFAIERILARHPVGLVAQVEDLDDPELGPLGAVNGKPGLLESSPKGWHRSSVKILRSLLKEVGWSVDFFEHKHKDTLVRDVVFLVAYPEVAASVVREFFETGELPGETLESLTKKKLSQRTHDVIEDYIPRWISARVDEDGRIRFNLKGRLEVWVPKDIKPKRPKD